MMANQSRFPTRQEILPVFSLVLFIVYSWTIFRMLYQVPSWLLSHSKHGLFSLSMYVFSFALFESLVILGLVLLLSLTLPKRLFRERFVAQGSLVILALTIWALVAQFFRAEISDSTSKEIIVYGIIFILSLFLITVLAKYLLVRFKRGGEWIASFAERTTVLAWIYIPLGIFSTIVVFFRNIL